MIARLRQVRRRLPLARHDIARGECKHPPPAARGETSSTALVMQRWRLVERLHEHIDVEI
ncbi:hypothetical protein WME91_08960 [Sorangium sp. So ce269]